MLLGYPRAKDHSFIYYASYLQKNSKMSDKKQDTVPQVGFNPTAGSDRVKAPVAGAGLFGSGGGQSFMEREGRADEEIGREMSTREEGGVEIDIDAGDESGKRKRTTRLLSEGEEKDTWSHRRRKDLFVELKQAMKSQSAPTSPNLGIVDLTWDEEKGRSVKRKCKEGAAQEQRRSPHEDKNMAGSIMKLIRNLEKEVRALGKVVRENANTKREIKDITSSLRSMTSRLVSDEMQAILCTMGKKTEVDVSIAEPRVEDKGCQAESDQRGKDVVRDLHQELEFLQKENQMLKEQQLIGSGGSIYGENRLREVATQTEDSGDIDAEELENRIKGVVNYESFKEIADLKWPSSCYHNVKIVKGDPMGKDPEADLVIIRDLEDPNLDKGLRRRVKERYPDIASMGKEGWETYANSVKKINGEGICMEKEDFVHIGTGGDDITMFQAFQKLVDHLNMLGRTYVAMYGRSDKGNEDKDAKMLECILRGGKIKVDVYRTGSSMLVGNRREYRNTAIVVSQEGYSYKQMLQRVKKEVRDANLEAEFTCVRKTQKGELLLEVKDKEMGKKIKGFIDTKIKDVRTRELGKNRGKEKFIIRDIDALCNKEEVLENVKGTATQEEVRDDVEVISLMQSHGDNQTAILRMDKSWGDRLVNEGGVKIGLVKCKMKNYINVPKCHKCWGFDHVAKECRGPDRSRACLKCGKDGHRAEDCKDGSYCPLCQREGHRAGSGACPKMRDMLRKLRKKPKW